MPHQQPPQALSETDSERVSQFLKEMEKRQKENVDNHFQSVCDALDQNGYHNALYYAVKNGWEDVATRLLGLETRQCPQQRNFKNPLSAVPYCTEDILKRLLEKYPELARKCNDRGENFIHEWLENDGDSFKKLDALKWLENLQDTEWPNSKASKASALCQKNNYGDNPLHIAARKCHVDIAKQLKEVYTQVQDQLPPCLPWLQENNQGDTPLIVALTRDKDIHQDTEDVALCLLTDDPVLQCKKASVKGESPLFLAVRNKCGARFHTGPDGQNPMHVASNCPASRVPPSMPPLPLTTLLPRAPSMPTSATGTSAELIGKLMQWSEVGRTDRAWTKACEGGHLETMSQLISKAFGSNNNSYKELYDEQRDTPLHHIKLGNKIAYEDFLRRPGIETLKNKRDKDGATPVLRALQRKDIQLVEALLNIKVNLTIRDNKDTDAFDLLRDLCEDFSEWKDMCNGKGFYPNGSSYIHSVENMEAARSTLATVAALLSTITFSAGIHVPVGLDEKTGYAKRLGFIVFLIFDTIAMCLSLLVLFFLVWAPSFGIAKTLRVMDLSVKLLQASLVGTIIAFMTGVYIVVPHELFWLDIVVIVVCCALVPLAALKNILLKVSS